MGFRIGAYMGSDGYIDLQVNGYAGTDFNDPSMDMEQIHGAARRLRQDGTAKILATVVTASPENMTTCLRNLVAARADDPLTAEVIAGFHVEGPFISPEAGYRGAHPAESVRMADRDFAANLLEAGAGFIKLFTLAPESDPGGRVTRWLADHGVQVAAGHTNASLDELQSCMDQGLALFTHLGNGCPMQMHRHDNIIQRALSLRRHLHYGLIADGVHLPPFVLRNIIDLAGISRCFAVTDGISAAGLGPGCYTLGGQTVKVDDTLVVWAADRSHFVGSAATMRRCTTVLADVRFSREEMDSLLIHNPARLIGCTG